MSATCDATAQRVTEFLGFSCHEADPVASLRSPLGLENWTLPVLEATVVAGAVFALFHAVRRLRRAGDPTNLALWVGSLVYLLIIEPPLYFPGWFGLQEPIGFMFAHNVFSVEFMYDRLPLYIIAFYPAVSQLAYELVRRLGVFERYGAVRGAVAVAFGYQVFYEIFDHLGPQMKWWEWNLDNPLNHPVLDSVPMNSMWVFAAASFAALTYAVVKLVGEPTRSGNAPRGWSLTWRIAVAAVLTPPAMVVSSIPTSVFGGDDPNVTAQAVVLSVELAALWLFGATVLFRAWKKLRGTGVAADGSSFVRVYPPVYLAVMAVLWAAALPGFFDAADGRTPEGTPVGNGLYVLACFVAATLMSVAATTASRRVADRPDARAPGTGDRRGAFRTWKNGGHADDRLARRSSSG